MFKVIPSKNNDVQGYIVTEQVEHWLCQAVCRAMDNRTDTATEMLVLNFELHSDFDETEGYVVKACRSILGKLGYSYCGLEDWQLEKYCYDGSEMFSCIHKKK